LYLKFCSGFALISDGYQNNLMCAFPLHDRTVLLI